MRRVLVIDDDVELCGLLEEYFGAEGFAFACAHNGDDGLRMLEGGRFDILILDVMLPDRDGFDILRDLRSRSNVPVIMLTARRDHVDLIVGLEIGADDYISKPFNSRELSARVRAVLRRTEGGLDTGTHSEILRVDDLSMDFRSRTATIGGRNVSLTTIEYQLLKCLLLNIGNVMSLQDLSLEVLNRQHKRYDRSIGVHMSNLRRKLGPYPAGNDRIVTVRGKGFVYVYEKQSGADG